jgi:outer membrane protein assembly factor BamD
MPVKHLLLIVLFALSTGCAELKSMIPSFLRGGDESREVIDERLSESEIYQLAQTDLAGSNYSGAVAKLKALESRYPFGRFAEQSQLELIYAYHKNVEPEAARAAADRFIRLHPQHPDVDYAYYLKGLTSFEQDRGLLTRFFPLDMTKRDPGAARDSFNDFSQLTTRFPQSRYAPDAKARMVYLRNLLAAGEIHIGYYYLKRKAYVASANRGRYVVENLQGSPAVGDGLALMIESYQNLGLDDLATTSLQSLKLNYPDHPTLNGGRFTPVDGEIRYSWLAKRALELVDKAEAPLPPQTNANKDILKQYQQAEQEIPEELLAPWQREKKQEAAAEKANRSWWSRLTFGYFD